MHGPVSYGTGRLLLNGSVTGAMTFPLSTMHHSTPPEVIAEKLCYSCSSPTRSNKSRTLCLENLTEQKFKPGWRTTRHEALTWNNNTAVFLLHLLKSTLAITSDPTVSYNYFIIFM
eukprot:scpid92319/ scgid21069/ 